MNPLTFSVLAEPNRLHIIELLYKHPQSVNEIVEQLHLHQPQVSKHLKILADAGMVSVYPEANKRIYGLRPERFQEMDAWLKKYRSLWEERFDRLDGLLKREKRAKGVRKNDR